MIVYIENPKESLKNYENQSVSLAKPQNARSIYKNQHSQHSWYIMSQIIGKSIIFRIPFVVSKTKIFRNKFNEKCTRPLLKKKLQKTS